MSQACLPTPVALRHPDQLHALVENRMVYSLDAFELNIFETRQTASKVPLSMGNLVLTTMLRGKKCNALGRPARF